MMPAIRAGWISAHGSSMVTMPGLPVVPAANGIDINDAGEITGLS